MNTISPYILVTIVVWVFTHTIKYFINKFIKKENINFRKHLFQSGGMPSVHSATSVGLLTTIAIRDGMESGLFGLATLFTLIVCYDATKVRRSSGEQGQAIIKLIKFTKSNIKIPYIAVGHTFTEVLVGIIIGAILAFLANYIIY